MSHAAHWRCLSCPQILGRVGKGMFATYGDPRLLIYLNDGGVIVTCPNCGDAREWSPKRRATLVAADE